LHKRFIFPNIQKFYYYVISYILVCFLIFYIYKNIPSYENRLRLTLLSQSIDGVDASSDRLIEKIVNGDPDFLKKNISYESLRKRNEKYLKEFRNRNISSIYLIFTTDNGRSFILIDSNNRESASEILVFILEDIDKTPLERRREVERSRYIFRMI